MILMPYLRWSKLIIRKKFEYKKGSLYLTSHRIIYTSPNANIAVPLFYVGDIKETGVIHKRINIRTINQYTRPQYEIDLCTLIYKVEVPPLSHYPNEFLLGVAKRDDYIKKLKELLQLKYWEKPLIPKIEEKKSLKSGISSISGFYKDKTDANNSSLSSGFEDILSLKKEAQKLV